MKGNNRFLTIMVSSVFASLLVVSVIVSCGGSPGTVGNSGADSVSMSAGEAASAAAEIIRVLSPVPSQEFPSGSAIRITFEKTTGISPDSVEIYFAGRLLTTIRDGSYNTVIPAQQTGTTGVRALRLLAYSGRGRPQSVSMFLTILSDLVPARYGYRIERIFSHDKTAYTQGLLFHNGFFYESTGQEGRSTLRKVDPETGVVIRRLNLEAKFFGEGIALLGDRIYQLTWKHKVGFVYDIENFTELGKFYYNTEGWGLTTVDDRLVMSDGSNKLYVVDPNGFITVRIIEVYDNKSMVMYLNELEYVNGEIWANVFMSDLIARIDPATGKVTGYIDLKGILPDSDKMNEGDDVLNGIAWDRESGRIWVTGKNWPKLFQIRVTGQ